MELKRQDPIIDSTNPFSDDCLNRKGLASALTNLVKEAQCPLVVALNGGWGTGKTFFLQRWIAEFEAV